MSKTDLTDSKPLFNDRARDKATEIRKQIGAGYGSNHQIWQCTLASWIRRPAGPWLMRTVYF